MKITVLASVTLVVGILLASSIGRAESTLSGDARTACEVMLCLSSPQRPSECNDALRKYFSIKYKKWSKTNRARKRFLNLCPLSKKSSSTQMSITSYDDINF